MAQPISSLPVGTRFVDPNGIAPHGNREWILVGFDQYGSGTALLLLNEDYTEIRSRFNGTTLVAYSSSEVYAFLDSVELGLSINLRNAIQNSTIRSRVSSANIETTTRNIFLLSAREYSDTAHTALTESHLTYFVSNTQREFDSAYWTRDLLNASQAYFFLATGQSASGAVGTASTVARYAFSIASTSQVADTANPDGSYNFELPNPSTVADLPVGTVVKDPSGIAPHGNKSWRIVGNDQYGSNTALCLLNESYTEIRSQFDNSSTVLNYAVSDIDQFLQNTITSGLSVNLQNVIQDSNIRARTSGGQSLATNRKVFLLGAREYLDSAHSTTSNPHLSYFSSNERREFSESYWTRDMATSSNAYAYNLSGSLLSTGINNSPTARYAFSIPTTIAVQGTPNADGSYNLVLPGPQTIDDLPLGTVVKDPLGSSPHGNRSWVKIAEDHFSTGESTFYLNESYTQIQSVYESDGNTSTYANSTVDNFLQGNVQTSLSQNLQNAIVNTNIEVRDSVSNNLSSIDRKIFLLSQMELANTAPIEGSHIIYFSTNEIRSFGGEYWTRSLASGSTSTARRIIQLGSTSSAVITASSIARYAFNLPSTTRVNPTANADGSYNLQLNQPPNKPVITQINGANTSSNSLSPQIVAPNMTFTTTYQDPDSDPLQLSNLVVNILGGSEVFNQNITTSTSIFAQDLTGIVAAGSEYEIKVRHQDNQGNFSDFSDLVYVQIGETATPPTPIAPVGAIRVGLTRQLEASIGSGRDGTPQHFKVRLRTVSPTDTGYPAIIVFDSDNEISSVSDQTGWEVRRISDQTYIALPSGGADSATYDRVRYTPQTNLQDTKAYLGRWSTYDTQYQFFSGEGTKFSFVAGNTIRFTTDVTDSTSRPEFAVGVYQGTAVTAGTTGSRDINMANNANDAAFTFEDADDLLTTGHIFANTTKTATNWGLQVDVSGSINETVSNIEPVNITGFSYAYRTV